jgi:hypothetical protein
MTKHTVIGRFGPSDPISVSQSEGEVTTALNLLGPRNELNHDISHAIEYLAQKGLAPSEIGIDVLILAAHVFASDTRISRSSESQDSWTREMRMVVPVSDPERWRSVTDLLKRMLNFLTGDLWSFEFRARPRGFTQLAPAGLRLQNHTPFDQLSLFSGGLDSLIGAIDLLESGATPLLISHAGDGPASSAQHACLEQLREQYESVPFDQFRATMSFPDNLVQQTGKSESTTRGRSFLFFALGVLAGTGLGRNFTLIAPENGLIAINVPLDPLRLGALSTRTMHPFYIARWNELLAKLDIPGHIENPYWKCTKGEMVLNCANQELLHQLIPLSMSCSSPSKGRWLKQGIQNCGYCLPCLIRRAALEKAYGKGNDPTDYYLFNLAGTTLSTRRAEGQQVRSFQVALARLRANPSLAKLLIYKPGPLSDLSADEINELAGVYQRGMGEVASLLSTVQTRSHLRMPS